MLVSCTLKSPLSNSILQGDPYESLQLAVLQPADYARLHQYLSAEFGLTVRVYRHLLLDSPQLQLKKQGYSLSITMVQNRRYLNLEQGGKTLGSCKLVNDNLLLADLFAGNHQLETFDPVLCHEEAGVAHPLPIIRKLKNFDGRVGIVSQSRSQVSHGFIDSDTPIYLVKTQYPRDYVGFSIGIEDKSQLQALKSLLHRFNLAYKISPSIVDISQNITWQQDRTQLNPLLGQGIISQSVY